MINYYKIKYFNNEECLYIYLDYSYEISSIENTEEKLDLIEKIKEFIIDRKIHFKGKYIILIIEGMAISTLACNSNSINNDATNFIPNTDIIEMLDYKIISKNNFHF